MDRVDIVQMGVSVREIGTSSTYIAFDDIQFDHEALMKLTIKAMNKIIKNDLLLNGLPYDPTVEEIKAQIAVARGQAITLYLHRKNLPKLSIVVPPHDTSVLDLKKAIKRQTNLVLYREKVMRKISWKHVWRTYDLCCNDIILNDEKATIRDYGINNRAELNYVRKRQVKCGVMKIT